MCLSQLACSLPILVLEAVLFKNRSRDSVGEVGRVFLPHISIQVLEPEGRLHFPSKAGEEGESLWQMVECGVE